MERCHEKTGAQLMKFVRNRTIVSCTFIKLTTLMASGLSPLIVVVDEAGTVFEASLLRVVISTTGVVLDETSRSTFRFCLERV
jgi:hypothetical protein